MKMKKTVYLHIGLHKTGTSAIQHFLSRNRTTLKRKGYLYPGKRTACYDMSDELLTKSISEILADDESPSKKYLNEIQLSSSATVILSSEVFIKLKKEQIKTLKNLFPEGYRIKIIVYLRRQDDKLESHYNQNIRESKLRDQQRFAESVQIILGHGYFDFYTILCPWSEVFGKENIIVRCYEKEQLSNGIFRDFLDAIGLKNDNAFQIPEDKVNISMNWDLIEIIRLCNIRFVDHRRFHRFLVNILTKVNLEYKGKQQRLLSPQGRREIIEHFAESNARVAREYLGRKDGRLFFAPLPDPSEPWIPYEGLTVEKFVTILTRMIMILEREHRKQITAQGNSGMKQRIKQAIIKTGARLHILPAMRYWHCRLCGS